MLYLLVWHSLKASHAHTFPSCHNIIPVKIMKLRVIFHNFNEQANLDSHEVRSVQMAWEGQGGHPKLSTKPDLSSQCLHVTCPVEEPGTLIGSSCCETWRIRNGQSDFMPLSF